MKYISTALGYIISIVIFAVGAGVFANNTNFLASATGNGLIETIVFGVGIMLFGLSGVLYQYKKSKSTKYLFIAFALFSFIPHSIIYTIRTHPSDTVTYTDISLLIVFAIINMYVFYLSYKFRRIERQRQ